jgi:hypothetical protein
MISPQMLKEKTALHDNVDSKLIIPVLKRVQDMYVQPLLGSTLYKKILADIKTNSLSGKYKELLDEYLLDVICQYALAEIAPDLNAQFYNKGVTNKQAEGSTAVTGTDLKTVIAKYTKNGEWYAERCKRYLQQYANQYYPEYYQLTPGIDTIVPTTQVWNCPISLGTDVSNVKPHAYYND